MCHYCGCRHVPLIRDYIAEHELVVELGRRALHEAGTRRLDEAAALVERMRRELASHWRGEERGVFTVMAEADDLYADYVVPLVDEHRELAAFLEEVDLTVEEHRHRLAREMDDLLEHISREEDGLFPATLVTLSGPAWDRAIDAWHEAHPGRSMIAD